MTLYTYIVKSDNGFAPNPFHGMCTLACCKPQIRRTAKVNDWVIGLSGKSLGHRLIYAMQVKKSISFDEYWRDKRFSSKKASAKSFEASMGDNIYEPLGDGKFKQHKSKHSFDVYENTDLKEKDLGGKMVLIADNFVYYGIKNAIELDAELMSVFIVGRGYRKITDEVIIRKWNSYIKKKWTEKLPGKLHDPLELPSKACGDVCRQKGEKSCLAK